jgi:serine/threonine protein kinase
MEIYMNELTTESPYELQKDMKFIEDIDHGAFGKVIHVHENKKNLELAVKVINKTGAGMQLIKKMKEEVSILKKLNHNNIVKFYGYAETNSQLLIKMEYIKYGTLSRWMKDHHKISEADASIIIGRVLSAVEYLHSMHICHRDIKPENIMMSKENDLESIKIIDFGLSAQHFTYLTNNDYCGTFIYMAPEQIEKKLYYYSVDIWSIGILMYMLLNNGKHPFYHKDDKKEDFIKKIKLAKLHFINKISYMAKHLLHKLCEPNPSWRYSANLAIKHPWITRNPNDDIPLTFNEILNKNTNKKNAHIFMMISIFLNYIQKNNKFQINNNNNNNINNFDVFIKKKRIKNKLFIINNDYIKKCNIISKKQKERYQKIRERYLEVLSTDEEDSFEKKQNYHNILSKKFNKSSEKYCSPPKKYYEDDPDYEYSNRFHLYNNKKVINKKKIINLNNNNNNNFLLRNNFQQTNLKVKNKSTNIHILSVPNNKEKMNNITENYNKKINSNKNININSNKFLLNNFNKNTINQTKTKCKSISKFYVNKNEQNDNNQNEIINELDYKELTPEKSKRMSVYKSSKTNRHQIKPNLPYVSTLGTSTKNTNKKLSNNFIGTYNIKPIVLPFIGIKQEDKKNKMI